MRWARARGPRLRLVLALSRGRPRLVDPRSRQRRDATEITALARSKAGAIARRVDLIDRFEGQGVPAGQVSLTLSFVFQDDARTLSSEEVESSMDAVRASFSELGYTTRGLA